ncbi:chemosensory receptor C [Elysia marginata]|uniref:Chemosensory receptor C n=1 Tax=Elysia marginata TaxID=1093978 RepID=A0AAV4FFJ7_9GAST|nr:chemosensory receptor C [Elysia marginata]
MNATTHATPTSDDIVSDRVLWIAAVTFRVCINSALSAGAFIANVINTIVFKRMGIDHATESFFLLSLADGTLGFIGVFGGLSNGMRYLGPSQLASSAYPFYIVFLAAATVPSLTSLISTTVIAVLRCCSVAMPFRVRTVFTARRQRFFILLCTVLSLAFLIYGLHGTSFAVRKHPQTNVTFLAIIFHPDYVERNRQADVYRGVMFYMCFTIVNVCLVVLIIALRRSYKFRKESYRAGTTTTTSSIRSDQTGSKNQTDPQTPNQTDPQSPTKREYSGRFKPGSKEAQVFTVVVLVSALFTICNIPAMVASILRQAVPGMNNVGRLRKSFDISLITAECSLMFNAAMNIVIYLKFNSRYYAAFSEIMRRRK